MGIIKTCKLVYEYIRRDENNEIAEKLQAIKGVDIDIEDALEMKKEIDPFQFSVAKILSI